jgi:hypothetical protein
MLIAPERFNRLPRAIGLALAAVPPQGVTGYLLCALERKMTVTGLLFCYQSQGQPNGSPIQTGIVEGRAWAAEYELIVTPDAFYVIAHRLRETGAIDHL